MTITTNVPAISSLLAAEPSYIRAYDEGLNQLGGGLAVNLKAPNRAAAIAALRVELTQRESAYARIVRTEVARGDRRKTAGEIAALFATGEGDGTQIEMTGHIFGLVQQLNSLGA